MVALPNQFFWADDFQLSAANCNRPIFMAGHRQVTNAYLFHLAIQHEANLAAFDKNIKDDKASVELISGQAIQRGVGDLNP